jgi:peroxiredoxin-like protein
MQPYPHHYSVKASTNLAGHVLLDSLGTASIESAPPVEFGGPGGLWSPETLLVAAVADCFVLSFRAIARASKLEWQTLNCEVEGVLEQVERQTRFTRFNQRVTLQVPEGVDTDKARRLLEKAERACLITNSLSAEVHLEADVITRGG